MEEKVVWIKRIEQKDNFSFFIEWNDGQRRDYRLSDLQRQCPCASCVDEISGKRIADFKQTRDDVRAKRIYSVGRYALRIDFTSGCSSGIYGFDFLYKMSGAIA